MCAHTELISPKPIKLGMSNFTHIILRFFTFIIKRCFWDTPNIQNKVSKNNVSLSFFLFLCIFLELISPKPKKQGINHFTPTIFRPSTFIIPKIMFLKCLQHPKRVSQKNVFYFASILLQHMINSYYKILDPPLQKCALTRS